MTRLFTLMFVLFTINSFAQNHPAMSYKVAAINGVRMREVPAATGQPITMIPSDEKVQMISKINQDWAKVRFNNRVGFVPTAALEKIEVPKDTTNATVAPKEDLDSKEKGKKDKKSKRKKEPKEANSKEQS